MDQVGSRAKADFASALAANDLKRLTRNGHSTECAELHTSGDERKGLFDPTLIWIEDAARRGVFH